MNYEPGQIRGNEARKYGRYKTVELAKQVAELYCESFTYAEIAVSLNVGELFVGRVREDMNCQGVKIPERSIKSKHAAAMQKRKDAILESRNQAEYYSGLKPRKLDRDRILKRMVSISYDYSGVYHG